MAMLMRNKLSARTAVHGLAIMLGLSLASLSQPASASDIFEARGKALVTENCGQCHAVGKDDTSQHAEAPDFRSLSKRYPVEHLAESLAEGIMTGHPDMPVLEFEAEQVEQIIAYLQSIQTE